jgi:hypothetical protein
VAPITTNTKDARKTTLVISAPGAVADYPPGKIGAEAAMELAVSPQSVSVTVVQSVAAAESSRRRLQSGTVNITITVYYATEAEAAAMETAMTNLAGTAAKASSFLTAALGREVTVTVDPAPPASGAAVEPPPPPPPAGGLSTGALVGIIIGAIAGVAIIGGLVAFLMMKKKSGTKVVSAP